MNTGTVPTWVSETSKAENRGKLVATQLSIAAFGIVIAYWMKYVRRFRQNKPKLYLLTVCFQLWLLSPYRPDCLAFSDRFVCPRYFIWSDQANQT